MILAGLYFVCGGIGTFLLGERFLESHENHGEFSMFLISAGFFTLAFYLICRIFKL
jgi:hypothetical protein